MKPLNPKFTKKIELFDQWLELLTSPERRLPVHDFFGDNLGLATSKHKLKERQLVEDSDFSEEKSFKDFSGLYVFYENQMPLYVGISRGVISRIHQHVKGTSHFSASWAYRLMIEKFENVSTEEQTRAAIVEMNTAQFEIAKGRIRNMEVSFIVVNDAIELYLFEVYASIALGTTERYNSFKTH